METVTNKNTNTLRNPRRRRWMILIFVIILIFVLGLLESILGRNTDSSINIPSSEIYLVPDIPTTQRINVQGTVKASSSVSLNFQGQGGMITQENVQVGDHVKVGQVLAEVDNSSEMAAVSQAQAGVSQAEGNVLQAKAHLQLLQQGPTSQTIAAAQAQVQQAKTALQTAEAAYQQQKNIYNDRTSQEAQVIAAENAVTQAQAALQTAEQNQTADQKSAQQSIASAQNQLEIAQQNLQTDEAEDGNVTLQQVQQAENIYNNELATYNSYNTAGYPAPNPYTSVLQEDETVYQNLSQRYYQLQQAEQAVKSDQQALAQAEAQSTSVNTSVQQAQAEYQAAERSLTQAELEYQDRTAQQQALVNAQNSVEQAKQAVQTAEADAEQETQPSTPAELQEAEAAVQTAQAGVQAAQAQLQAAEVNESYTILKAPVDGIITQVIEHVGDTVGPTTPVFTLDMQQEHIDLAVSESQLNYIQTGDSIDFQVPEVPGKTFKGQIFKIYPTPITGNGNEYKVLASIDTSDKRLSPGMTGNVTIHLGSSVRSLVIPSTAIQNYDGHQGVYVIASKQEAKAEHFIAVDNVTIPSGVYFAPLVLGVMGNENTQVLAGLKSGDKVLIGEARFYTQSNADY